MKLFAIYDGVRTNYGDSDDRDLYVLAGNAAQAIDQWRTYYGVERNDEPQRMVCFPFSLQEMSGHVSWKSIVDCAVT
jgi:hypothetical protein